MGYYRGEYEEYYRNIKVSSGKSTYSRGRGNSRSTGGYARERKDLNRGRNKRGSEHIYDFLKIMGIQALGVCSIGALIYVCGLTEDAKFVRIKENVVGVVSKDYYFGEDKFVNKIKDKVLNSFVIEGIEGEKEKDKDKKDDIEEEVIVEKNEITLKALDMIMPTVGEEKKLEGGKVQIKGERGVFSAKSGEITYVKDGKVIINHGDRLETVYEKVIGVEVKKGQKVDVNEQIGKNDKKGEGIIFYILKNGEIQNVGK